MPKLLYVLVCILLLIVLVVTGIFLYEDGDENGDIHEYILMRYGNDTENMTESQRSYLKELEDKLKSCEADGGKWGLRGEAEGCRYSYEDGGKECQSSTECIGNCEIRAERGTEEVNWGLRVANGRKGACQSTSINYGCFETVEYYSEHQKIRCRIP